MKQAFAILGAALLVALGLFLPRLTAAYQDQNLAGDVRRMENAAVSLTLAEEVMELTELDLFQSLELFSSHITMVELEEGRYMSAEDAAQIATDLSISIPANVYLVGDGSPANPEQAKPDLTIPFLLTDEYGRSGIFWRCEWEGRSGEAVWIDDQNGALAGFCLQVTAHYFTARDFYLQNPIAFSICQRICNSYYPANVSSDVFWSGNGELRALLYLGNDTIVLPMYFDEETNYLYFNIQSDKSASGETASGEADSISS